MQIRSFTGRAAPSLSAITVIHRVRALSRATYVFAQSSETASEHTVPVPVLGLAVCLSRSVPHGKCLSLCPAARVATLEEVLLSLFTNMKTTGEGERAAQFVLCLSGKRIYSIDQAVNNLTACNGRH